MQSPTFRELLKFDPREELRHVLRPMALTDDHDFAQARQMGTPEPWPRRSPICFSLLLNVGNGFPFVNSAIAPANVGPPDLKRGST
jgi:hypothetical protein